MHASPQSCRHPEQGYLHEVLHTQPKQESAQAKRKKERAVALLSDDRIRCNLQRTAENKYNLHRSGSVR